MKIVERREVPGLAKLYLAELDAFIAAEITPLEQADDNISAFSTTAANGRAPISKTAACPATNGRRC